MARDLCPGLTPHTHLRIVSLLVLDKPLSSVPRRDPMAN